MRKLSEVVLRNRNISFSNLFCTGLATCTFFATSAADKKLDGLSLDARRRLEIYQTTNLLTAHFHFEPDQWEKMTPVEPSGGMFGGPGGRGPGGPRPGPGGPGGFGPGMFLAPAFLRSSDLNSDAKMSRDEFSQLASKWFTEWNRKKADSLQEEQVRDGLNSAIMPPGGGGGPGIRLQGAQGKRNGLASAAGIEFNYVKGSVEVNGTKLSNVAVRYKGNGTWMGSRFDKKRSMKVDLNEFVSEQKYEGLAKLNFHNCVTDAGYMNEVLSYRLYRDAGVPASRTAYARVYVDVPGKHKDEYFGVYSVVENVDSSFTGDHFGTKKGVIFKPVTPRPFEYLGESWSAYEQTYDPKNDLTEDQKKRVMAFCKLVSQADNAEFAAKLGDYLDLDNFSRYMAVTAWLATLDSILGIGQNYYVYLHPKTGKLNFIPWDLDHSFGQFFMVGSQEDREKLSIAKPWQGDIRFLARVFETEAFQKLYRTRMEEFSKTIFRPDRFVEQVDEIAAAIRPAVKDESETKLARLDKVAAGEAVPPSGFGPPPGAGDGRAPREGGPGPGFGAGFMQPAKPIKGFVKVRTQSVIDQLSGKEQGKTVDGGFGPRGGRGPGGFGPGNFMAPGFLAKLDKDSNNELSRDEFVQGFQQWFTDWDKEKSGSLTEEQLREGLNVTFAPPAGGPGGLRGGGPVVVPLGTNPRTEPKP